MLFLIKKYCLPLLLLLFCTFFILSCKITQLCGGDQTVNPLQFGIYEAKTGEDRYYVLLRTHEEAQRLGLGVTYDGIMDIDLTIPDNAKPIPLTQYTDFAGVTIQVENNQKGLFLFTLSTDLKPVNVSGDEIDNKSFLKNPTLSSGSKLLVITDKTPWVEQRRGHDYGATRKDIMIVKNGIGENEPVQSYCTQSSVPECYYCDVNMSKKIVFKNLTLERTASSTEKTFLVRIENQCNINISGITINTPEKTNISGDRAIYIVNCANVNLSDITINGTYSLSNAYGYGVSLNNTYNLRVNNMFARANWGVFGNNNINNTQLANCDINRFDIHCYGRDVSFVKCNFVDLYNQFSSIFGKIDFKDCTFTNFTPILLESSYNAYTAFDATFENCVFNFDDNHFSLIDFSGFGKDVNSRLELKAKCLPNVTIRNCHVYLSDGLKKWYVYNTKKTKGFDGKFDYISKVVTEGSDELYSQMELYSHKIKTTNKVEVSNNIKQ